MQKRHIWDKLIKEIDTPEIVVITGPRQVGKTTSLHWMLEQVGDNKIYFDLENLIERELFEVKDYRVIVEELKRRGLSFEKKVYIGLDEIQQVSNLPSVVKYLYDNYDIKFLLSGSSSYYIKNKFSESMAGRKVIYEIFPLSFQEFLDFKGVEYQLSNLFEEKANFSETSYHQLERYYLEFVNFGGLPKVVLTDDENRKRKLLEEIFSSYINIDVQSLSDFKSTTDLRRVIKLLAARIGSKLNVTEISKITGLSRITVDNYVEFLEQSYLITTVPAYSRSVDVKTRLQVKPYFIDTGIATVNADLSGGEKFENAIRHQLSAYGQISYFDDRSGEIDFIVETEHKSYAFEVKQTPTETHLSVLKNRAKKLEISEFGLIGQQPSVTFTDFVWGGGIR